MSIDLSWWKNPPPRLDNPDDILRSYILNPAIPIHDPQLHVLERKSTVERLYFAPPGSASTTIVPQRDLESGKILNFIETPIEDAESTARNSMSFKRAPGPPESATRGSAVNYPFWPGGFDEPATEIESLAIDNSCFERDFLTIAPGFSYGLDFQAEVNSKDKEHDVSGEDLDDRKIQKNCTVDLLQLVEQEESFLGLWKDAEPTEETKKAALNNFEKNDSDSMITVPEKKPQILEISSTKELVKTLEWAEMIDITQPVTDFAIKVPNPAHKYPFELDIFQKQAIIKLEEHNHVFVAAHTSAGKTVVAEYAIALSQQHMTRAVYTSPIKALSNQKYRDFKNTFKDVGLITGDIQIDPTSSCLIMTTEILRSMLYCGSEVTRDLEYVIFDEVHYITDPDRGHVWEEVLILLPDHVTIVMLSATVPNTLEFANWVGMTKKRKVYVISTPKRPVPLMHYLYTGSGGRTKNNFYMLVNEIGEFSMKGYREAIASLEKESNSKKFNTINTWIGLIDFLKRNDKLPVVAFTLSRNRCDQNLKALQSVDLCTGEEAAHVHLFFSRCLQRLKPEDQNIPQVLVLQDSLKRGIGVHHSGILPILKEIVEILFQTGYVKILFATETFAMGVNMPARTVVFDSHRKYDGLGPRDLRPAEYTQMAGRAGRRGLDKTGTVILMCRGKVPAEADLRTMILGKPMSLKSKFRLTHAMILNLLRVESVTVEDMMSHSFMEFELQTKIPEKRTQLRQTEEQISKLQDLSDHVQPFCQFYDLAYDYIQSRNEFMNNFSKCDRVAKDIKTGCVMIITHNHHYNKLAIVLLITNSFVKGLQLKVLVLDDQTVTDTSGPVKLTNSLIHNVSPVKSKPLDRGELWHQMISLAPQHKTYEPDGFGHKVLQIKVSDIVAITKLTLKIEADKLLQNWDQRQLPRFLDTPPGPTFVKTVTELYNLNKSVASGETKLQFINLKKEFKIDSNLEELTKLKAKLDKILHVTNVPNFELEFAGVFDRKQLETRREELKFKISKESLSLYPEYLNKLEVFKNLNYIDQQHEVTMKGRVACEMGSNELIITELVLCNIFTDLDPAEIAALLSSLVFQAKTDVTPVLTDNLKKCIEDIKAVDAQISSIENQFHVQQTDDSLARDRLNFGLVEVVYEWAKNKSFAEIMTKTDVQEGIIVRCIQQLNETLQDVQDAARIIGNPALHKKMEDASNAIKRDIVFAASLYFQP